jgi:hypothetical protein
MFQMVTTVVGTVAAGVMLLSGGSFPALAGAYGAALVAILFWVLMNSAVHFGKQFFTIGFAVAYLVRQLCCVVFCYGEEKSRNKLICKKRKSINNY